MTHKKELTVGINGEFIETTTKDGFLVDKFNRKYPTNTTKDTTNDMNLILSMLTDNPNEFIPAQERNGQREFINSDTIPTKFNGSGDGDEILTSLGFKLGEKVEDDTIFRYVELPKGWKKEGSDHAMWSYILDDKGNERMSIFYKAAFYDRIAHYRLTCRFHVSSEFESDENFDQQYMIVDKANLNKPIFVTPFLRESNYPDTNEGKQAYYQACDNASKELNARLKLYFPDHKNPAAYWGKEGDDIIKNEGLR